MKQPGWYTLCHICMLGHSTLLSFSLGFRLRKYFLFWMNELMNRHILCCLLKSTYFFQWPIMNVFFSYSLCAMLKACCFLLGQAHCGSVFYLTSMSALLECLKQLCAKKTLSGILYSYIIKAKCTLLNDFEAGLNFSWSFVQPDLF